MSISNNKINHTVNDKDNAKPVIRKRNIPSRRCRSGLIRYAKDVTSQNGEDGIIERIFELFPSVPIRYCVDVGAWDGKHLSNTYSLLVPSSPSSRIDTNINDLNTTSQEQQQKQQPHQNEQQEQQEDKKQKQTKQEKKWHGILVEANTERFQQLKELHDPFGNICLNEIVSSSNSLKNLLSDKICCDYNDRNWKLPYEFDFLCIDIDGDDYWLLHDLLVAGGNSSSEDKEQLYSPKVICIEFNPTMPHDLIYIPPRNNITDSHGNNNLPVSTPRHGASLPALVELATMLDYVLVETTIYNAFFVRKDYYTKYLREEVPDTSIETLHEVTMGTTLYQLYDGTIQLWGCKKLLWHRLPMEESKIQILPPDQRHFPFAPPPTTGNKKLATSTNDDYDDKDVIDLRPYCCSYLNINDCENNVSNTDTNNIDNGDTLSSKRDENVSSTTSTSTSSSCSIALLRQLQKEGFAFIRGTGISQQLCQDAMHASHAFLHDAEEDVRRSCLAKDRARRGYSPMNTENFASLIGQSGEPNDLVRKFRMGPSASAPPLPTETAAQVSTSTTTSSSLLQPNIWPQRNCWEHSANFQETLEEYYDAVCKAAHGIVQAIHDATIQERPELKRSMNVLVSSEHCQNDDSSDASASPSSFVSHTSILTLLGYRFGSRHKIKGKKIKKPLVAAHTDVGVITVLLFNKNSHRGNSNNHSSSAALQRKVKVSDDEGNNNNDNDGNQNDQWVDVDLPNNIPEDPIFVVNIGDCLSDLSHGYLPSTLHRVVACGRNSSTSIPRTSLALFVGLHPKEMLSLPSSPRAKENDDNNDNNTNGIDNNDCSNNEDNKNTKSMVSMTYEEWRKRRIATAQSFLKTKKENL